MIEESKGDKTNSKITDGFQNDLLYINGRGYTSRLFHCFGTERANLTEDLAVSLIKDSGTQFITFNTHNIDNIERKEDLILGFSSVTLGQISKKIDISQYTLLNNINHAKSWKEAVERARKSCKISGSNVVKLEVLSDDLKISNDVDVIKAAEILIKDGFEIMPLMSCNFQVANKAAGMGCSLLRVMGSPIGSLRGIDDEETMQKIFTEIKPPAILDGGIGSPEHVLKAMKLGASGVLVNALLFASDDPVMTVKAVKEAVILGRKSFLENKGKTEK